MDAKLTLYRVDPNIRWSCQQSSKHDKATGTVHREYHTSQGTYATTLYADKWTNDIRNACANARRVIAENTSNGLVTEDGLKALVPLWDLALTKIQLQVDAMSAHWDEVIQDARTRLVDLFDPSNYPDKPYTVTASLSVVRASWPAELDDATVASLMTQSEANLRDEVAKSQQAQIDEVIALVDKVKTASEGKKEKDGKRPEKTRKAAIRRIHALRRMNLMGDPAYDARIVSALESLGANVADAPIFESPWGAE